MQTGEAQQATPGTIMGTGTGTIAARSGHLRQASGMGLVAASAPVRPPHRRPGRRPGYAGLLAAMAAAWMAAQAGVVAAQTICPRDASYTASFSVTCNTTLTCTFTNTSAAQPSGFASLEWDFGDGNFMQGAAAAMSPFAHTYGAYSTFLVTMTLTAGDGQVAVATGSVTLNTPGQPPVPLAADDFFTTPADTPLTIAIAELLANDLPGVTFVSVNGCALSPAGDSCTFPAQHIPGVYGFTYTVQDAVGNQGAANVFVTVTQPLVANPDYFSTYIGVPIQITSAQLLANDLPTNAVFVRAENPVNGTLTFVGLNSQGAAVYQFTPPSQSSATGIFDYLISLDGNPPYAMGFVYINVLDQPPIAAFAVQCVNRMCTVHSTSTDDTGTIPTYTWDWGDGTVVTLTSPNQWFDQTHTYAHSGYFTITLTVTDTAGLSSSLQLEVLPNTPPIAANVIASTKRDVPAIIDVLATASDPDGDPLTVSYVNLTTPGASWQLVQLPNGRWGIKVTPPDTFVGTMTFTFTVCDPWGGCAAPATVTLTVMQWQVIVDALGDQFFCYQNSSISFPVATLLANDYDQLPGTNRLTIASFDTSILAGTLVCTTTVCTFTPNMNQYGRTIFRYTASDQQANLQDTATVTIYVGSHDQAPTVSNDFFTTTWGTPMIFTIQDLFQNAVDADGDILTVILNSGPTAYGSLNCSTPMYTCTYTPNPGFAGTDSFTFTASDMVNPPVTAVITVLTLPLSAPTFDAREAVVLGPVNQSIFIGYGVLANDYAPSGGPIVVTGLDTTNIKGSLGCGSSGCTYTPPFLFQGVTSFKYTASDSHGATDTAIVRIVVGGTDPAPVAAPQALSTHKNTALRFSIFDLMHKSYDPANNPLTVLVYPGSAKLGSLSCTNPNYWCTYTPNADTTGADAITYLLTDGYASVQSTLTITITP